MGRIACFEGSVVGIASVELCAAEGIREEGQTRLSRRRTTKGCKLLK